MAQVNEKRMQREYETRLEDIYLEQRQQQMEVEKKHAKEVEISAAEVARMSKEEAKARAEADGLKMKTEEYKNQLEVLKKENEKLAV